ncbi:MAG: nucleoside hydrolase [Candidatus Limnocylindrales bacterium]
MGPRSMILDMDVGVDDALAILYLAGHPEVRIAAVGSVHGNVEAPIAAANARRVLELCGLDEVPVAVGCWRPLAQELATAGWVHGEDGLGDTNQPPPRQGPSGEHAVAQLIRLAHERPGAYEVVATGPLTNLGTALVMDRELPHLIRSVTIMGGSADGVGNAAPFGEANIWHDPEAAELVFNAGWPITMVGLDVTMVTRLEEPELAAIAAASTPQARFATAILQHYLGVYAKSFGGRRICPLHDPLAAGIAVDPTLVTAALDAEVHVSRGGDTRGMTMIDRRPKYMEAEGRSGPFTRVALQVDSQRFVDDLVDRLTCPFPGRSG